MSGMFFETQCRVLLLGKINIPTWQQAQSRVRMRKTCFIRTSNPLQLRVTSARASKTVIASVRPRRSLDGTHGCWSHGVVVVDPRRSSVIRTSSTAVRPATFAITIHGGPKSKPYTFSTFWPNIGRFSHFLKIECGEFAVTSLSLHSLIASIATRLHL